MWDFFTAHHNWFIGAAAFIIWGAAIVWYFGPMVRHAWRNRNAEYFRKDS